MFSALFLFTSAAAVARQSGAPADLAVNHPAYRSLLQGAEAYRAFHYEEAVRCFARSEALTPPEFSNAILRAQAALLAAQVATHRYREALSTFDRADRLAVRINKSATRTGLAINLSTLYANQSDYASAQKVLQQALADARPEQPFFTTVLVKSAQLFAGQDDHAAALRLLDRALWQADRNREDAVLALAWEVRGHSLLHRKDFAAASRSFSQAVRWCRIAKVSTPVTLLRGISVAHEQLGDQTHAEQYLTAAIEAQQRQGSALPSWVLTETRAQQRARHGADAEALADAAAAMQSARQWRLSILPSRNLQTSTEVRLQDVYTLAVTTGTRLIDRTHDARLVALTLQAAEENRAINLRNRLASGSDWESRLPAEYWEILAQYRRAATAENSSSRLRLGLEQQLAAFELRAGLHLPAERLPEQNPTRFVAALQSQLPPESAAFTFQLGAERSYLWAITNRRLALYYLPGRDQIASSVAAYRKAVEDNSPAAKQQGRKLYDQLFGLVAPEFTRRADWVVSVDDCLFELPFAALVTPASTYLIEDHSVQMVPSLLGYNSRFAPATSGTLAAIADPVFHAADPRFQAGPQGPVASSVAVLPRLPNSAREVAACARIWSSPANATLLTGASATVPALRATLKQHPAVLHISTHFVSPPGAADQGLLALSVHPTGEPAYLNVQEVSTLSVPGALVVLNGCSTGSGKALPGAGWLGMTRAWLLAGARNVAAAYWPVSDDEGVLWQRFYRHFRADQSRPAEALRQAQLDMLHSPGWRAQTRYWAAYFLTGRG